MRQDLPCHSWLVRYTTCWLESWLISSLRAFISKSLRGSCRCLTCGRVKFLISLKKALRLTCFSATRTTIHCVWHWCFSVKRWVCHRSCSAFLTTVNCGTSCRSHIRDICKFSNRGRRGKWQIQTVPRTYSFCIFLTSTDVDFSEGFLWQFSKYSGNLRVLDSLTENLSWVNSWNLVTKWR